ncbi:MAG: universal stress protein [Candidatus Competibacteraceae bacterium]
MHAYQHILLATDFTDEALEVGARAKEIARHYGARLSLVHVIEPIVVSPGYDLLPVLPEVPDEVLQTSSQEALRRLAERLEIEDAGQRIITGVSTKEGILEAARELAADLIVIGSHGRHGLALLLGSTANAVLHGAPCDVLAVRIHA